MDINKQLHKKQYMEELQQGIQDSRVAQVQTNSTINEIEYLSTNHMNMIIQQIKVQAGIEQPSLPVYVDVKQDETKAQKAYRQKHMKALLATLTVQEKERDMLRKRTNRLRHINRYQGNLQLDLENAPIQQEHSILAAKLKQFKLEKEAAISQSELLGIYNDEKKLELSYIYKRNCANAIGDYARMLPPGSSSRKLAMIRKEDAEIEANKLQKKITISKIQDPPERKREKDTFSRHKRYEFFSKIFPSSLTKPISMEDATFTLKNGHTLVNVGRAFFGGTKAMYKFEDRESRPGVIKQDTTEYKTYLFKEASNCIGLLNSSGAEVTAAASNLQQTLCGRFSIPAVCAYDPKTGKVIGSFQEKIEAYHDENTVNLFSWQSNPKNNLPQLTKSDLLREHTLDWLLCNFDTKGENFINQADGHIISFDKEASFKFIKEADAQNMSYTYKPHENNTIYNVLFEQFAKGNITLNLRDCLPQIVKMEQMSDDLYMENFKSMLDRKYGPASPTNTSRKRMTERMLERKNTLRNKYEAFFSSLLEERKAILQERFDYNDTIFKF